MERLRNLLILLRNEFWVVPLTYVLGSAGLAYILLTSKLSEGFNRGPGTWWSFSGDTQTALQLLSSYLGGLMTMTSLVVSVTFVILTLAANQRGPRLIPVFIADRKIQSVLGLFLGTILYTILTLSSLDEALGSDGIPRLAVTAASGLTILCVLSLLFYIHKIIYFINADNVVEEVSRALAQNLEAVLPTEATPAIHEDRAFSDAPDWPIALHKSGCLQVIDYPKLLNLACRHDLRMKVHVCAGDYILCQGAHVSLYAAREPEEKVIEEIKAAFTLGSNRTPAQDPAYNIRQLVEMALRALSPGINDPLTAETVIDRLGSNFEIILGRHLQPTVLHDDADTLRIYARRRDLSALLGIAFDQIRQDGAQHPAILIRIARTIAGLAPCAKTETQRTALSNQLGLLEETLANGRHTESDRSAVSASIAEARTMFATSERQHA